MAAFLFYSMEQKEWFKDWFDSKYYHILYQNRNEEEAAFFLNKLVELFNPNHDCEIIDLACGKGRHSIYLNSLGYKLTGVDLAEKSINYAKQFENDRLHFEVQDLRNLQLSHSFDIALNLFTSFGYFDSMETNKKVLQSIHSILNHKGSLLIDFLNIHYVKKIMKASETKIESGITFQISKKIEDNKIIKDIRFKDQGTDYHFQEQVQALCQNDFIQLLNESGFKPLKFYGNYQLEEFNPENSERLIILAAKQDA